MNTLENLYLTLDAMFSIFPTYSIDFKVIYATPQSIDTRLPLLQLL